MSHWWCRSVVVDRTFYHYCCVTVISIGATFQPLYSQQVSPVWLTSSQQGNLERNSFPHIKNLEGWFFLFVYCRSDEAGVYFELVILLYALKATTGKKNKEKIQVKQFFFHAAGKGFDELNPWVTPLMFVCFLLPLCRLLPGTSRSFLSQKHLGLQLETIQILERPICHLIYLS